MDQLLFKIILQAMCLIVIVVYFTIFFVWIAMVFLPKLSILVILIGLVILLIEWLWARKLLKTIKNKYYQKKEVNHAS
jgi:tetrahydromethanopterin S-methyltransferase subunit E